MFKFLKRNLFVIVFIIFVFMFVFIRGNKTLNEFYQIQKRQNFIILKCATDLNDKESSYSDNYIKYCQRMLSYKDNRLSFYNCLSDMIVDKCRFLNYLGFLIVVVPALYYVCKLLKNGYIVNYLTRKII